MSKILVIEDDNNLSEMYTTKFTLEGFAVVTANDGDKGIVMASSETPDLILLDILMPNVNGFEVLRQLKTDPATKNIPVIVYTNLGTSDADEKRELAFSLGASDYLVKALHDPESIVQRINQILKPRESVDQNSHGAQGQDDRKMAA